MPIISEITIVNRACAKLGIDPLQDMEEETIGGQTARLVYDSFVELCLGLYPWSFGKEIRALAKLSDVTSEYGFAHVFDLPGDRIGPPIRVSDSATDPDRIFNRFVLYGGRIHADADPLFVDIKYMAPPDRWSATFREAVVLGLAGELALAMVDDANLRAALRSDAFGPPSQFPRGGAMGAAITEEARATPARRAPVDRNPLTMSWRS